MALSAISDITNVLKHLTTSSADLYECPTETIAEIKFALVSNVDGTNDADFSLAILDYSETVTVYASKNIVVPADAALKPLGDLVGLSLKPGDKIQGLASNDGDIDILMSIVEYSVTV